MAKATQQRFRSCFVSAPFGADTSALRSALEERGVLWADQTSIQPGGSWLDVLDQKISDSDFVCVVLPHERSGNILFELGVAYAKRKPILAFVTSPSDVPSDIPFLTYVRADVANQDTLYKTLDMFLEHAQQVPTRRIRPPSSKLSGRKVSDQRAYAKTSAEFERKTADLLQQAGFIVSEPSDRAGADFAVWIDETDDPLGNPILVEVKAGDISIDRLRAAASELRRYAASTHSRCALLVYWDRMEREFPSVSTEWPLVLQLSGPTLTKFVSQGRVAQELLHLRNAAVHNVS